MLQNKKYIKFANDNTVEVLALGRLDEGIQSNHPKAATYKAKDAVGNVIQYMVKWPGLTTAQIQALRSSKAGTYNNTGGVPYGCLVNPHTLKRMHVFKGVTTGKIMDEVKIATKALRKEHGKGMKRAIVNSVKKAKILATAFSAKGNWDKAILVINKATSKSQDWPETMQDIVKKMRQDVTKSARTRLDEIKNMAPKPAMKAVRAFMSKAKTTSLFEEAKAFADSLKAA